MRMTNKIIQNNSLYNINNNKRYEDKLSTQMATNKKLTRPSDDPVVAIRALRLRSSVSEITQYYEKNAPDADSWLEVTGKSLLTINTILTNMKGEINTAANKEKAPEDLAILIEQLKSLRNEYYSTGNVDYAGRYVFTGYRTDTPLSFNKEVESKNLDYSIIEQIKLTDLDSINYTDIDKLEGLNKGNYQGITVNEQDISNTSIHRIRLSYDDTKNGTIPTIKDVNGNSLITGTRELSTQATPDPYKVIQTANENGRNVSVYVPETGEILLSDKAYARIEAQTKNGQEIRVTYEKDAWKDGDLRPEHYFACQRAETENGVTENTAFNLDYLTGGVKGKDIEYDVGYNQKIKVNTNAREVFSHGLDRDIDDLDNTLNALNEVYTVKRELETVLKGMDETNPDYNKVKDQLAAANRAYSYTRENMHSKMQGAITDLGTYVDDANLAITDNGTRSQRLDLVSKRLMEQRTTFRTLQSNNEDIDLSEVTVQLTSANLSYQSALMATGKIMQNTLMQYI